MFSTDKSDLEDPYFSDIHPDARDILKNGMGHLSEEEMNAKIRNVRNWLCDMGETDFLPDDLNNLSPNFFKESVQKLVDLGAVVAEWEEDVHGNVVKDSLKGKKDTMLEYYKAKEEKRKEEEEAETKARKEEEDENSYPENAYKYFCGGVELDPCAGLPKYTPKEDRLFWESIHKGLDKEFEALKSPDWKKHNFKLTETQRAQLIKLDEQFSNINIPPSNPVDDSSGLDSSETDTSSESIDSDDSSLNDETLIEKKRKKKSKNNSEDIDPELLKDFENLGDDNEEETIDVSEDDDDFLYYDHPPEIPENITPENQHETIPAFARELRKRREEAIKARKEAKLILRKEEERIKKLSTPSNSLSFSKGVQVDTLGSGDTMRSAEKPSDSATSKNKCSSKLEPNLINATKTHSSVVKATPHGPKSTKPATGKPSSSQVNKSSIVIKWVPPKETKEPYESVKGKSKNAKDKLTKSKSGLSKKSNKSKSPEKPKEFERKSEKPDSLVTETVEYDNILRKQKKDEWMVVTGNRNDPTKVKKHFIKAKGAKFVKKWLESFDEMEKHHSEDSITDEEINEDTFDKYFVRAQNSPAEDNK